MARHWAPLKNPALREARSRSIIRPLQGIGSDKWGQRPMFSEPGENQPPPEDGRMPSEAQPDAIHPKDGRISAEGVGVAVLADARIPVHVSVSDSDVADPPTDAEIRAVLGQRVLGDTFLIRDGSGNALLWLIVRGGADSWYYLKMTKAV